MDFSVKIKPGLVHSVSSRCDEKNTALALGSGSLPVYATPAMAALMEQAAAELTEELLPAEWTSVGIRLELSHTSATPCGLAVRAEAQILAVDGRSIAYELRAFDEQGEIGHGHHERFLVQRQRFLQKAEQKLP